MAPRTFVSADVPLEGDWVRKRLCGPSPVKGTYGVVGVVPVKLNELVKRTVAFPIPPGRTRLMVGGRVTFEDGVTLKAAFDKASNLRYWTVVPLIQFRTKVTLAAEKLPRV